MITEEKKQWAIEQLREKNKELGRLPKKDDFDVVDFITHQSLFRSVAESFGDGRFKRTEDNTPKK